MKIDVITTSGEKKGSVILRATKTPSPILVSNVILANLSNKRRILANTKTKGEVSGGGKKPWRQKGTGRARAGSSRSPLWTGGGITFGPKSNRNFYKRINKKQSLLVLNHLINQKAEDGRLKIIKDIRLSMPKTKELIGFLSFLGVNNTTLLVLDNAFSNSVDGTNLYLAGRNISFLKIITLSKINAYLVSKYNWLIMTEKALEELNGKFEFMKDLVERKEVKKVKTIKK